MPVWLRTNPSRYISQTFLKEMTMKTLHALMLASFIGLNVSVAYAADAPVGKPQSAKAPVAATVPATQAAPVKISQQDKMRLCAKEATGKKGAERKTFMKTCLSKKA
jgi:psiF repeat-containing protein